MGADPYHHLRRLLHLTVLCSHVPRNRLRHGSRLMDNMHLVNSSSDWTCAETLRCQRNPLDEKIMTRSLLHRHHMSATGTPRMNSLAFESNVMTVHWWNEQCFATVTDRKTPPRGCHVHHSSAFQDGRLSWLCLCWCYSRVGSLKKVLSVKKKNV